MTTYTAHADALFDPDKPILGSTQLEQRDNLIATAEGATGAPVVNIKALGKFTAGETRRYYNSAEYSSTSSTFATRFSTHVWGSGVARLRFDMKFTGSSKAIGYVYVGGVLVFTVTSGSSTYVTYSTDITIAVGDEIDIQIAGNAGTQTATIRNIELLTNGEQLLPCVSLGGWVAT